MFKLKATDKRDIATAAMGATALFALGPFVLGLIPGFSFDLMGLFETELMFGISLLNIVGVLAALGTYWFVQKKI